MCNSQIAAVCLSRKLIISVKSVVAPRCSSRSPKMEKRWKKDGISHKIRHKGQVAKLLSRIQNGSGRSRSLEDNFHIGRLLLNCGKALQT